MTKPKVIQLPETKFLGPNWGLETITAQWLYHNVAVPLAKKSGRVDAHTHLDLRQIVDNEPFSDPFAAVVMDIGYRDHYMVQMLAGGKHGFAHWYDTTIPNEQKWLELASEFPNFAMTQSGLWVNLTLRDVMGIDIARKPLNLENAGYIWGEAQKALSGSSMLPQELLRRAHIKVIATTDDPKDDLAYHGRAARDIGGVRIIPTFRPDAAMNIFDPKWDDYVTGLCQSQGQKVSLDGLLNSLKKSHDFFAGHGCRASDHGMAEPYGWEVEKGRAAQIFEMAKNGNKLQREEVIEFISFMMDEYCKMDIEKGLVTQIHFGPVRNMNAPLLKLVERDAGGDGLRHNINIVDNITPLLNAHYAKAAKDGKLVLYCMDPSHYATITALARAFPGVYVGTPWWFNDSKEGITRYLNEVLPVVPHSRIAGMVCDSRCLTSVSPRHELYARDICNDLGNRVESGTLHIDAAKQAVKDLCLYNQSKLFGFNVN